MTNNILRDLKTNFLKQRNKETYNISNFNTEKEVKNMASVNGNFEVYQDKKKEWRWRLKAENGNIVADGGEGYKTKAGVEGGIASVKRLIQTAEVLELDAEGKSILSKTEGGWFI